mmetsp:Transcript_5980/g.15175  ORF Transcript_5980/g.15175 Transcript_5980/m.15175 type:complete len:276 (-) Transcript_5980:46-873(-)
MDILLLIVILFFIALFILFSKGKKKKGGLYAIKDKYESLGEVTEALRVAGLESSNLIIGIDYTKSNLYSGTKTFYGKSLHDLSAGTMNPYQHAISVIGRTLEEFDDDKIIPTFGFGDEVTTDRSVFALAEPYPYTFQGVLDAYNAVTPHIKLHGPTSFAPIIFKAIDIVKKAGRQYHILVIIADGQVTNERETIKAIEKASQYPLSIVVVGVGDGPWDVMEEFDDRLPKRKFDNFQFVNYHKTITTSEVPEIAFAVAALQEIPEQFKMIRKLDLL